MTEKIRIATKALLTRSFEIECSGIHYRFSSQPYKKTVNWLKLETSKQLGLTGPNGWPTHLMLEPTNRCDLHCDLCPVNSTMTRAKGDMDLQTFRRVIDENGETLLFLLLWNWGEPLLNPSLFDMIAYAGSKGIKVIVSSNGMSLEDPLIAEKVVASGPDTIIIALDGLDQATYSRYRRGGILKRVQDGIRNVSNAKTAAGTRKPLIDIRFLMMVHNEQQIPYLKDRATSLGADILSLKTLNDGLKEVYTMPRNSPPCGSSLQPENLRYRRIQVGNGKRIPAAGKNRCRNLWNNPVVLWDGSVTMCSYDYDGRYRLGNIHSQSFRDIWFGRQYRDLRKQFRDDWRQIGLCQNCSYRFEGGGYEGELFQVISLSD